MVLYIKRNFQNYHVWSPNCLCMVRHQDSSPCMVPKWSVYGLPILPHLAWVVTVWSLIYYAEWSEEACIVCKWLVNCRYRPFKVQAGKLADGCFKADYKQSSAVRPLWFREFHSQLEPSIANCPQQSVLCHRKQPRLLAHALTDWRPMHGSFKAKRKYFWSV